MPASSAISPTRRRRVRHEAAASSACRHRPSAAARFRSGRASDVHRLPGSPLWNTYSPARCGVRSACRRAPRVPRARGRAHQGSSERPARSALDPAGSRLLSRRPGHSRARSVSGRTRVVERRRARPCRGWCARAVSSATAGEQQPLPAAERGRRRSTSPRAPLASTSLTRLEVDDDVVGAVIRCSIASSASSAVPKKQRAVSSTTDDALSVLASRSSRRAADLARAAKSLRSGAPPLVLLGYVNIRMATSMPMADAAGSQTNITTSRRAPSPVALRHRARHAPAQRLRRAPGRARRPLVDERERNGRTRPRSCIGTCASARPISNASTSPMRRTARSPPCCAAVDVDLARMIAPADASRRRRRPPCWRRLRDHLAGEVADACASSRRRARRRAGLQPATKPSPSRELQHRPYVGPRSIRAGRYVTSRQHVELRH